MFPLLFFKCHNSRFNDLDYVHIFKEVKSDLKEQYASLVYNRENLNLVDSSDTEFTISDLRNILTEIKGKIMSYDSS